MSTSNVSLLINNPSLAPMHVREALEARSAQKKQEKVIKWKLSGCTVAVTPVPKKRGQVVEGATQKTNGKWIQCAMFPGREFDDLDAYRAAKKQRAARREEYSRARGENPRGYW